VTAERVREALGLVPEDEFLALLDVILERRAGEVFAFVGRLADAGIDYALFLSGLADILRAQLAVLLGGELPDLPDSVRRALEERRTRWSATDLLRMLSAIGELEPRFRKSGQQQLLIETLLVRFTLLDRTVEIEDLLRRLSGEGGEAQSGRGRAVSNAADTHRAPRRDSAPSAPTVDVPRATERTAPNEKPVAPPPPTLADVAPPAPSSAVALGTASEPLDVTRL